MKSKHYLEEELFLLIKKNNEVFDFIQDFALDGLWYWDLDNPNNEWMNKKFWLTLGYEPGELPYTPNTWNKLIYEKIKLRDEAGAIEALGLKPKLVRADATNLKVTYPADLALAAMILRGRK